MHKICDFFSSKWKKPRDPAVSVRRFISETIQLRPTVVKDVDGVADLRKDGKIERGGDDLLAHSCGTAGETVFGGASRILGPRGELLAAAGAGEEIVTAALDFSVLAEVRNSINVFHDRRQELYRI